MLSKRKIISISTLLPLVLAIFSVPGVHASTFPACPTLTSGACSVSVSPTSTMITSNAATSFTISVLINNLNNLSLYEVYLNYNPSVLTASSVVLAPGLASTTFWCQADCTHLSTFANEIVQGTGTVHVGQGITNGGHVNIGSSSLILFQISFSATHPGSSSLSLPVTDPNGADNPKISECSGIGMCKAFSIASTTGGSVVVPPFVISTPTSPLSLTQGQIASVPVTVSSILGFVGTINLHLAGSGSVNYAPSATLGGKAFIHGVVLLTAKAPTTSLTLTVEAQPCTPVGSGYSLTVSGVSGSLSNSLVVPVTVTAATVSSFCLTSSASSVSVVAGGTVSVNLGVCSANGFSGTVAIAKTVQSGAPKPSTSAKDATVTSANTCASADGTVAGNPVTITVTFTSTTKTVPGTYAELLTGTVSRVGLYYALIYVTVT